MDNCTQCGALIYVVEEYMNVDLPKSIFTCSCYPNNDSKLTTYVTCLHCSGVLHKETPHKCQDWKETGQNQNINKTNEK